MPEGGISPERKYRELKQQPEAREYRDSMAAAIKAARAFDGTEQRYHELMGSLEALEETVQTSSSVIDAPIIEQEIDLALKFAPLRPRDINDVLGLAEESRKRWLRKSVESENAESPLLVHRIADVILPPDKDFKIETVDGSHPIEPAEFEDRVGTFLKFLERNNIYVDDVVITVGHEPVNSFREISYTHIEIPKLNRTVLLCDQIGEATFVLRVYLDPATQWTKEQLQEKLPNDARRIVKHSQQDWEAKLGELLFTEEAWGGGTHIPKASREKVDVRGRDALRYVIRERYTVDQLLYQPFKLIRGDKFEGVGGWRMACKVFDIEGDADAVRTRLAIISQVWGESDPVLEKYREVQARTLDEWRRVLKTRYTPEIWRGVSLRSIKTSVDLDGYLYADLMTLFGIQKGTAPRLDHLKLGAAIWGPGVFPEVDREYGRAPDGWITVGQLAARSGRSPASVDSRVKKLRVQYPEWFGEYTGSSVLVTTYMSPEVADLIERELDELPEQKSTWSEIRTGEYDAPDENRPEGWKTVTEIAQEYHSQIGTIQLRLGSLRPAHPRWFGRYRNPSTGSVNLFVAPEAIAQLKVYFEDEDDLEQSGWPLLYKIFEEYGIKSTGYRALTPEWHADHPGWVREPLDPHSRAAVRVHPQHVEDLVEYFKSIKSEKQKTR